MPSQIHELTKLLQHPNALTEDIGAAFEGIQKTLEKNYLHRVHTCANEHKHIARQNPPREVALLRAMKQFPMGNPAAMDQLIDTMMMMHAFRNMHSELKEEKSQHQYSMQSDDGQPAGGAEAADLAGLLLTLAFFDRL